LRLLHEQDASSKLNALRLLIEEGEQSEDDINFSMDSLKKRLDSR